jgi:hypothetical protein
VSDPVNGKRRHQRQNAQACKQRLQYTCLVAACSCSTRGASTQCRLNLRRTAVRGWAAAVRMAPQEPAGVCLLLPAADVWSSAASCLLQDLVMITVIT